jgi:hypothetical protein
MTYQVTTKSVRPSTSVSFFAYPKQFIEKWKSQATTTLTISNDKLTETRVTLWSTKAVYDEFLAEKENIFANRDAYNTAQSIVTTTTYI